MPTSTLRRLNCCALLLREKAGTASGFVGEVGDTGESRTLASGGGGKRKALDIIDLGDRGNSLSLASSRNIFF